MASVATTPSCSHNPMSTVSSLHGDPKLHSRSLPRQLAAPLQAAPFRPIHPQHPKTHWQRSRTLRAVSESSPALKKPKIASKPQMKEPQVKDDESTAEESSQVTIQFQREQAKAMRKYFKSMAYSEEVVKSRVFGWTPKNEITNGRWVMFGFAVGLLTEYATGVDFIQQLKLMVSYLGIADIYD